MSEQRLYNDMSDAEKKKEDWMNSKWRPMMGWMYMAVCSADFIIFPVLWSVVQVIGGGEVRTQWQPITLQGAGLFHIAMGAVLGIAAYGRTQEKMNGSNNGGLQVPSNVGTTYVPPAPSFSAPQNQVPLSAPKTTSSFSAPITPAPSWGTTPVMTSSSGKPMPVQPEQPEL